MPRLAPFAMLLLAATVCPAQSHAPSVQIRRLALEKLTRIPGPEQQRIVRNIKAQKFDSGTLDEIGGEVSERVRDALQRMGYFKAIVYDPKIALIRQDNYREIVDVVIAADEGEQYRLGDVVFRSAKAFPSDQLRALIPLQPGDIFNIENVRIGLKNLRDLYGQFGYVNFTPVPDTQFNDEERTISLTLDLDEGPVFYFGKLNVGGEESEPGARDKLLQAWKKYEGKVFNPAVLDRFLQDLHVRPGVRWEDFLEISQDNVNHVINVYMSLSKPPQY